MMPGNPVVGGTVLRRAAIQSPNFVSGSAGWTVNADGTAQFSDLVIYAAGGVNLEVTAGGVLITPAGLSPTTGDPGVVNADAPGDLLVTSGAVNVNTATEAGVQVTSSDSSLNVRAASRTCR